MGRYLIGSFENFLFKISSIIFSIITGRFPPIITKSFLNIPYTIHNDNPIKRERISQMETSSIFLVRIALSIWGMVLQIVKIVAAVPIIGIRNVGIRFSSENKISFD